MYYIINVGNEEMKMNGIGLMNPNGTVNLGPNSPIWSDEGVATCVGDACKADSAVVMIVFVIILIIFSILMFSFHLREGGWKRTIIASIVPVWLISATIYHFMI
jgi:hypothetical protein